MDYGSGGGAVDARDRPARESSIVTLRLQTCKPRGKLVRGYETNGVLVNTRASFGTVRANQ